MVTTVNSNINNDAVNGGETFETPSSWSGAILVLDKLLDGKDITTAAKNSRNFEFAIFKA